MAAVEVTISGVLYDKTARTTQPVVLIGEATLTGLGVGGGPIIPDPQPPKPPTWGGHPEHPIYHPPHPEHPIVLPPGTPVPPNTDVIWPPQDPNVPTQPITIVPPGKVMVYVDGWIIVDAPPPTMPTPPAKPK